MRSHLTFANVMATLLAFIVLGGSAAAFATHSVGSKQLKNKAVTAKKIRNGAVTSVKIANGAVTGASIKPASFKVTAHQEHTQLQPNDCLGTVDCNFGGTTANCPSGEPLAGGGLSDPSKDLVQMEDSRPVTGVSAGADQGGTFTGWRVFWANNTEYEASSTVYVICLG